ncbi:DUF4956 domain-containing protein [Romboutsia lituseburensis]|uniref:Uncharacterized membrane protein YhiD, involved in acid resistance n=1 Tax=Romboutsia lituseburensis DSM 797 TaxID=1121325 RepID=A0A1G9IZ97_9FIRM|nr:DUF4956 domain-containing protein [Romboutsia lituseburensis]CEH33708.1 Major facilitator transporter [Romboutsia lituseburensis]SDL30174.1 Uncharacterized membrane protein YhiD, involved in acid resistance [Romboutsia lituseburensis DSM 797]
MTFNDVFKSSFVDKVSGFSAIDSIIALGAAFLVGLFIYMVYKKTFMGVMYSRPFNVSLVALTMLTTFVILAVTSNVVLSLGMVGALSIVRFRTAIKDPMDLVFLFWAIASGIVLGAGLIPLAIFASIVMGLILVFFANKTVLDTPYILMINCSDENSEEVVNKKIKSTFSKYQVKSKSVIADRGIELVFEVRMKNGETKFVNELSQIQGVTNSVLVSYNGDYAA